MYLAVLVWKYLNLGLPNTTFVPKSNEIRSLMLEVWQNVVGCSFPCILSFWVLQKCQESHFYVLNTWSINLLYLADRCNIPLGLEDKRLSPGSLSASTYYNHHLSPWHGRLNHRWSWSSRRRDVHQWFKVNFGYVTRFKGIATQGRQDANQWVKTYIVRYSGDGVSYVPYTENRRIKVSFY